MKKDKDVEKKKKELFTESTRRYTRVSPSGHNVFDDPMDTWAHDWT